MLRASLPFAVGLAVWASASSAMAMGFGPTATRTTLGEPLDFVVSVMIDADEVVPPECVFADVFAGDARVPAGRVRAVFEPSSSGGPAEVRVTTETRIDEPIVTIEVSLGCTSKLSRRFVAFIDPAPLQLAEATAPVHAVSPSAPRRDPQSMLLSDIARSADSARERGAISAAGSEPGQDSAIGAPKGQRVAIARSGSPAIAKAHPPLSGSPRTSRAATRSALVTSNGGAHLQLEAPLPADAPRAAASEPHDLPTPALEASAPLAVADAASEALRRERERIEILEAGLARLRSDSLATQRTVLELQGRLREAESQRYANGLVYALAVVALLFAMLAAGLWWVRPRARARARWFDAAASRQARAALAAERAAGASPAPEPPPPTEAPTSWQSRPAGMGLTVTSPAAIGGLEVTTVLGPEAGRTAAHAAHSGPKKTGELSIEELIDLEQQAEFFVVLGQEEAAISLLEGYMHSDYGKSPLPYLRLLELHQRRGDPPAYERVRANFNARFHALAPEWSDDIHFGRELDEYPQTIARLQALWPTPLSAMQALDSLLFRRHATDDTFDFPAYRELLFLYSIARELSGHVETDFGSIDVLLPLEDAPIDLTSSTPDGSALSVDLDVSSWTEVRENWVARRASGRRGAA